MNQLVAAAAAGTVVVVVSAADPHPEIGALNPITATKRGRLWTRRGKVVLRPMYDNRPYTVDATASCLHGTAHDLVPAENCLCGFHATRTREDVEKVVGPVAGHHVELDVELFGRVIVHERGWRASRQRVLGAKIPGSCHRCWQPATAVVRSLFARALIGACDRHIRFRRSWTPAEVASDLGCEVMFGPEPEKAAYTLDQVLIVFVTAHLYLASVWIMIANMFPHLQLTFAAAAGLMTAIAGILLPLPARDRDNCSGWNRRGRRWLASGILAAVTFLWVMAAVPINVVLSTSV